MATEFRRIVFPHGDVEVAVIQFFKKTQLESLRPPQGRLSAVDIEEDIQLTYRHTSTGSESRLALSPEQAAAILMLRCRAVGIPIPRQSEKLVSLVGEHISLDIYVAGKHGLLSFKDISHGLPTQVDELDEMLRAVEPDAARRIA